MLSSSFYVSLLLAIVHTLQNKMSMLYVLAKDISPQTNKKAIRLRLIRTYIVTEGRNKSAVKSQECVFHDIEGTYVHASIHADFIDQFSHLQKEGFPSLLFRIKPIEELLAGKVEEKLLIDVIGRVVEFYSRKDKVIAGFPTQLVDFLIEDSKGNRIKCTLWDEHVPAVMPFFNNHSDGHLIVLLQLCRAKTVDNEVRISSSYTATKVLFNLDCQDLKANCSPIRSIYVVSYGHSANNSQSPMVVSTIRDLYERAESKMQVPVEFEQLRNKSMVFRINLKNEHIRNPAKPISVLSESESGDEAISPIVQANLKLKGVANDQDEVDTGAIKRCLLDQFSSSQNLKKCRPLVIKEEKTL
nr:replication protein A 70 kDa DNA-binding subunit B-like [Ipomoea batatas]